MLLSLALITHSQALGLPCYDHVPGIMIEVQVGGFLDHLLTVITNVSVN